LTSQNEQLEMEREKITLICHQENDMRQEAEEQLHQESCKAKDLESEIADLKAKLVEKSQQYD
jgi:uncharacterized protein YfcZ (UPF0381/DUF406 family)